MGESDEYCDDMSLLQNQLSRSEEKRRILQEDLFTLLTEKRQLEEQLLDIKASFKKLKSTIKWQTDSWTKQLLLANQEKEALLRARASPPAPVVAPLPCKYDPARHFPASPRTVFTWFYFRRFFKDRILPSSHLSPLEKQSILLDGLEPSLLKTLLPEGLASSPPTSEVSLLDTLDRLSAHFGSLQNQKAALRHRLSSLPAITSDRPGDYRQWQRLHEETLTLYIFLKRDIHASWSPAEAQISLKGWVLGRLKGKLPAEPECPQGSSSFAAFLGFLDKQIGKAVQVYASSTGHLPLGGCLFCGRVFSEQADPLASGTVGRFHFPLQCTLKGEDRRQVLAQSPRTCRRCLGPVEEDSVHEETCTARCTVCLGAHHLALCPVVFPLEESWPPREAKGVAPKQTSKGRVAEGEEGQLPSTPPLATLTSPPFLS